MQLTSLTCVKCSSGVKSHHRVFATMAAPRPHGSEPLWRGPGNINGFIVDGKFYRQGQATAQTPTEPVCVSRATSQLSHAAGGALSPNRVKQPGDRLGKLSFWCYAQTTTTTAPLFDSSQIQICQLKPDSTKSSILFNITSLTHNSVDLWSRQVMHFLWHVCSSGKLIRQLYDFNFFTLCIPR